MLVRYRPIGDVMADMEMGVDHLLPSPSAGASSAGGRRKRLGGIVSAASIGWGTRFSEFILPCCVGFPRTCAGLSGHVFVDVE